MDNLRTHITVCQGGLISNTDPISQATSLSGSALRMINYEPSLTGGYRRISGYQNTYGTVPGTGAVLGVHVNGDINDGIFACRKPETGYNYLHKWNASTESWDAVTTAGNPDVSNVERVRFTNFNWSQESFIITDGVNPAAVYDGTTYTQITDTNAPSAPLISEEFSSHIFLAGDPSEPFNLYFSAPINATDFAPANGSGVINVGFKVTAIKKFRNNLYIFGSNSIKRLVGTSIADFVLSDVTANLGCVAPDSVVEFGGDILFLGPDGIRPVSGTDRIGDIELATVSKEIQNIFDFYYLSEDVTDITLVVLNKKSQFRLFFKNSSGLSLLAGIRKTQGSQGVFEYSQLIGLDVNCAASGYIGQYEYVIHGDVLGRVFRQEQGTSFDGEPIFSLYQTPYYFMDDPELRKVIYKLDTYLKSEGESEIFVGLYYDYENPFSLNPASYSFTTAGAAASYATAIYDSGDIFDGNPSPKTLNNVSGSGKSVSVSYVTNDTNASHTIQALTITYGLSDRR